MQTTWTYPNVRIFPLNFYLVVNGIVRNASNGQVAFQTEHGPRGLYRELRDQGEIKDTDKCQVYAGVDLDNAKYYAPIN